MVNGVSSVESEDGGVRMDGWEGKKGREEKEGRREGENGRVLRELCGEEI